MTVRPTAHVVRLVGIVAIAVGGWLAVRELLRDPEAPKYPLAPVSTSIPVSGADDSVHKGPVTRTQVEAIEVGYMRGPRSMDLHAADAISGEPLSGVLVVRLPSAHADPETGQEIARTADDGLARISIDPMHVAVACLADGYVPEILVPPEDADQVTALLSRSDLLKGSVRLPGGVLPRRSTSIVAYPPESDLAALLDCLRSSGWSSCPGCSMYVADTDGAGEFVISGACSGREYELAVVGSGLVSTDRTSTATAGAEPVVIPVAFAYAARVEAVDQMGRRVFLFNASTLGVIGGVAWSFRGPVDWMAISNSSLMLSEAAPTADRERGSRTFVATSDVLSPELGQVAIDATLPGYSPTSIVIPLRLIDAGVAEHRAAMVRTAPCLGDLRLQFTPVSETSIPEGKIRLTTMASGESYELPVHPNMLGPDRSCLVRGIPCGEYSAFVRWEISRRCVPSESGIRVVVDAEREGEISVDTCDLVNLTVRIVMEDLEQEIQRGVWLGIGDERRNSAVTDGAGMRFGDLKPVQSDTYLFEGLSPGRYCLLLGASEGVVAFEWIDVAGPGAEFTLVANSRR